MTFDGYSRLSPSGATAEDYDNDNQKKYSPFRNLSQDEKEKELNKNRKRLLAQFASLFLEVFLSEKEPLNHKKNPNAKTAQQRGRARFERPHIVLKKNSSNRYIVKINLPTPSIRGTHSIEKPEDHSLMTIARDFEAFVEGTLNNLYDLHSKRLDGDNRNVQAHEEKKDEESVAQSAPDSPNSHSCTWHLLYTAHKLHQGLLPFELIFFSLLWLRATSLTAPLLLLTGLKPDTSNALLNPNKGLLAFTPLSPHLEDWPLEGSIPYAVAMLLIGAYLFRHLAHTTTCRHKNNIQLEAYLNHITHAVLPKVSYGQHLKIIPAYLNLLLPAAITPLALSSTITLLKATTDDLSNHAEKAILIACFALATLSAIAILAYCKNRLHGGFIYAGLLSTLLLFAAYSDLSTDAAQNILFYGQCVVAGMAAFGHMGGTLADLLYASTQQDPWPEHSTSRWLLYPAFLLKIMPNIVHVGLTNAFLVFAAYQLLQNDTADHTTLIISLQITALFCEAYQRCLTDFTYENASSFPGPTLHCDNVCSNITRFFTNRRTYLATSLIGAFVGLFYFYHGFEAHTNPLTQYYNSFILIFALVSCLFKYKSLYNAIQSHHAFTMFMEHISLTSPPLLWTSAFMGFFNPSQLDNPITPTTLGLLSASFMISHIIAWLTKDRAQYKQKKTQDNKLQELKNLFDKVQRTGSLNSTYLDLKQRVTDTAYFATTRLLVRQYREIQKQQLNDLRLLITTYEEYKTLNIQHPREDNLMFEQLKNYHGVNIEAIHQDTKRAHTLAACTTAVASITFMLVFAPTFLDQCFNTIEYPGQVALSLPVAMHMIPALYNQMLSIILLRQEPHYGDSRELKHMINHDNTTGGTLGALARAGRKCLFWCCKPPRQDDDYQLFANASEISRLSPVELR